MISPDTLAAAFTKHMRIELPHDILREVDAENARRGNDGSCASHDHCDANVVMEAALCEVAPDLNLFGDDDLNQDVVDLWNAAWTIARKRGFADTEEADDDAIVVEG